MPSDCTSGVVLCAALCAHILHTARGQTPFNLTKDCFSQLGERSVDVNSQLGVLLNQARSLPVAQAGEALRNWQKYCIDNGGRSSQPCSQYTIRNNSNLVTTTSALAWDCLPRACRNPENREVYEFVDRVRFRNFQEKIIVVCMNENAVLPGVPTVSDPPPQDDGPTLFTEDNMRKAYEIMTYVFASLFGASATGATILGVKVRQQYLMIKDTKRRLLIQNGDEPIPERPNDPRIPLRANRDGGPSYGYLANHDDNDDDPQLHLSDLSDDDL